MKIGVIILMLFNLSFAQAQDWQTDFQKAKQIAATENKPIILVFQGLDWCAPCIKLDREIWSSETFKKYAKEHYVMLQANFPRKSKNALPKEQAEANARLAEIYNKHGIFPLVVILNSEGKVLGETGYKKMSPEEYIAELNRYAN